jgi:hypothetical protein
MLYFYSFHFIFKSLAMTWTISTTKAGPLSDAIERGHPYLGIISLKRDFTTSCASSVWGDKPQPTLSKCRQEPSGTSILNRALGLGP